MCELRPLLAGELVGDELTALLGDQETGQLFPLLTGVGARDKEI